MTHVDDAEMFVGELESFTTGELPDLVREEEYSIAFLAGKVDALSEKVEALTAKQAEIATMLAAVLEQVGPLIDQLSSHPMFKMIFGGK